MPNRIIKESICVSDTVDKLKWFEEVTFYRLIVNCDDYGRFDGRTRILKSRLFPLKTDVTEKQIKSAINSLSSVGLVQVYMYDQKPFLQITNWAKHQSIRTKRSKYPSPQNADESDLQTDENNCMQMNTDASLIQSNTIQSESISESEYKKQRPQRHKYGEYNNVLLSDEEIEKLKSEFVNDWRDRIERLSCYMESTGKTYKNHLATIRNWAKRDKNKTDVSSVKKGALNNYEDTNETDYAAIEQKALDMMLEESNGN